MENICQSCHGNFELHQFEYRNHDDIDFWQEIKKYDGLITTCLVKNVPDRFPVAVIDALLPVQIIHKVQGLIETCLSDKINEGKFIFFLREEKIDLLRLSE